MRFSTPTLFSSQAKNFVGVQTVIGFAVNQILNRVKINTESCSYFHMVPAVLQQ